MLVCFFKFFCLLFLPLIIWDYNKTWDSLQNPSVSYYIANSLQFLYHRLELKIKYIKLHIYCFWGNKWAHFIMSKNHTLLLLLINILFNNVYHTYLCRLTPHMLIWKSSNQHYVLYTLQLPHDIIWVFNSQGEDSIFHDNTECATISNHILYDAMLYVMLCYKMIQYNTA